MKGLLTVSDGVFTSPPGASDSKRVTGIDGWEPLDPFLNQCHGECFEDWWRSGPLVCTPLGADHCIGTTAPACGGVCAPGHTCTHVSGECTCVFDEP